MIYAIHKSHLLRLTLVLEVYGCRCFRLIPTYLINGCPSFRSSLVRLHSQGLYSTVVGLTLLRLAAVGIGVGTFRSDDRFRQSFLSFMEPACPDHKIRRLIICYQAYESVMTSPYHRPEAPENVCHAS